VRPSAYSSPQGAKAYLMYRCAELTVNAGYDYFLIVGRGAIPPGDSSSAQASGAPFEKGGSLANPDANATGLGGSVSTPQAGNAVTIRALRGGSLSDHPGAFAARAVLRELADRSFPPATP
jgi:hypothetical protein